MMEDRLRPLEITRLRVRHEACLQPYEWSMLFHYSMRGYERRGYKKYHNSTLRRFLKNVQARQSQPETEER